MTSFLPVLPAIFVMLATAQGLRAQCGLDVDYVGYPGLTGPVSDSTLWDPDGSGPLVPRVAMIGDFRSAGTQPADRIAVWDPATGGFDPVTVPPHAGTWEPRCVAAGGSGNLYVGGKYANLTRWSAGIATTLSAGGSGIDFIEAVAELPNGDVVAGGHFTTIHGVAAANIASWNGSTWQQLGNGLTLVGPSPYPVSVYDLLPLPNGNLLAFGNFDRSGATILNGFAVWDGSSWSPPPWGIPGTVRGIHQDASGELGARSEILGTEHLLVFDGTTWNTVATFSGGYAFDVEMLGNDRYVAVGSFTAVLGMPAVGAAYYDGSNWSPLFLTGEITGSRDVFTVSATAGGDWILAGNFDHRTGAANAVRFDGSSWHSLSPGVEASHLYAAVPAGDGAVYFAGPSMQNTSGAPANVVRWDGNTIQALGVAMDSDVTDLLVRGPADLLAVGFFTSIGSTAASHIARWDGSAWQPMMPGFDSAVWAIAETGTGEIVAAGSFHQAGNAAAEGVAAFDGSTWSALGTGMQLASGNGVFALAVASGSTFAGGRFQLGGVQHHVAELRAGVWSPLDTGLDGIVYDLLVLPNGDLIAGGRFTTAGGIAVPNNVARWDGTSWHAIGPTTTLFTGGVRGLGRLPNGDLLVTGTFATVGAVMRFDGTAWSPLVPRTGSAWTVAFDDEFGLAVAGQLSGTSSLVGRIVASCPATEQTIATACVGPAGPMTLSATRHPWLGGEYLGECSGFVGNALAASVFGFTSPATPLANLHPVGLPGCDLLADDVAVRPLLPSAGLARDGFAVPQDVALIGVAVHHQLLQLELQGGIPVSLSGSNALVVTVGAF
ncbi:MAG: hypothetical protein KDE27_26135 [Planctomycetes bacterium]|nr:hypothetical protein [Planctomycetota bacterium]